MFTVLDTRVNKHSLTDGNGVFSFWISWISKGRNMLVCLQFISTDSDTDTLSMNRTCTREQTWSFYRARATSGPCPALSGPPEVNWKLNINEKVFTSCTQYIFIDVWACVCVSTASPQVMLVHQNSKCQLM